ncbi:hypothetical protein SUNI508_06738 [Seiridium unicorne]|uniref:Uncharacterized protein n=1 Tax=Seiridium unicorne TaxID=138068 RepID=A0ABR2V163_9PEZI
MSWPRTTQWALIASAASLVNSQYSGWAQNQVNATMCLWQNPRVATIKDTAYIDGGWLWWTPGMADGTLGNPVFDGNPLRNVFLLNFSKPFNTSDNISEIFDLLPIGGSNGNALNNLAPNYFDGALLANDHEFFMYGGLLTQSDVRASTPNADSILAYQESQYGTPKGIWTEGFFGATLPDNTLNRYLAYGGAANAPSENKAYYFGGLHSPTWGEIYVQSPNASLSALNASNTLITLDMTTQLEETWKNVTLPSNIKGRGGPDLVWVPVGAQGILVALGGVTYPDFSNPDLVSANEGQSEADSPAFMADIDIYDIAGDKWYKQPTIAGPPQLALGCAVVAVAQDASSYNIYYYGGYDGIHQTQSFNDDVWILSLPSFMWMKVSSGNSDHARAGHRCVKPYPDQMIVIGGYPALEGGNFNCVEESILQIFNLTEGKWMESYDPDLYADYGVPEMIHLMIGGSETGGATMTVPTPSGWATPALAQVFETKYPTSKITTYYPYTPYNETNPRTPISNNGVPSWLAPVLGVVLGLVFLSAIVVAILLYRRRKLLRQNRLGDGSVDENGNRILSWMRGQDGTSNKAQTVTSEEPSNTLNDMESQAGGQTPYQSKQEMAQVQQPAHVVSEMPDTPLFEMMDTSPRVELGDTGLTPVDIINKHSHFARTPRSTTTPTNPSSFSNYSSNVDHASISTNSQSRAAFPASDAGRPDSPALGHVQAPTPTENSEPLPPDSRVVSGVSSMSGRDQAHLRNISDVSASTTGSAGAAGPPTPIISNAGPFSPLGPVSPPSATSEGREDYFQSMGQPLTTGNYLGSNTGSAASPLRRSVFVESQDDLGEKKERR